MPSYSAFHALVPWNHHCDAREESAERLGDSSQGVREPAATSLSPLRALPNLTKRHRDGRSVPRREQHRRIRAPACHAVPDLRRTRIPSEGHWPRSGRQFGSFGLCGPDAQPNVHWSPAEVLAVVAWYRIAAALETAKKQLVASIGWGTPEDKERESLRQPPRRQLAKADPRNETCRSSRKVGTGRQGRKVQRWRGTLRPGRDLHDARPAQLRDRGRRFPPIKSGHQCFEVHNAQPRLGTAVQRKRIGNSEEHRSEQWT